MRSASVAYETTSPNGTRAASASTLAWNSGTTSRSTGTAKNVRRPARYSRSSSCACSAWRRARRDFAPTPRRSEEHTSELQSRPHLVCRLLLEKKKIREYNISEADSKKHDDNRRDAS